MNLRWRSGLFWPRLAITLCLATAFSGQLAMAKHKHRKLLPPAVLHAKSVYLDVRLWMYDTPYYVEKRVRQWGRFRIVPDPKDADLVFLIEVLGDDYGSALIIMDGGYHKVYLTITTNGGSIPYRCAHLIDLFRKRLRADEKANQSATSSTEKR